jgi:hypothetical protein
VQHWRQHGDLHSGKKINNSNRFEFSLTNDVVGVAVGVVVGGGGASATAVDVATGAAVAADADDAVGAVVPRQL